MRTLIVLAALLAPILASTSAAAIPAARLPPDIVGTWQGTLTVRAEPFRMVVRIARAGGSGWTAVLYSIDDGPEPLPASTVTLAGSNLKLAIPAVGGGYEGVVSADRTTIEGTFQNRAFALPLSLRRATTATAWPIDASPHAIHFVTVDHGVKLEVLDWGGRGPPLVLLAGLGDTAHVFDRFAPKLTASYHVLGITRRGFGTSSAPRTGYTAFRLGDDVVAALDTLKISRPVLVGHSIAGEELSSIGSRNPVKVAGLVYLDAAYGYAFFDPSIQGDPNYLDVEIDDLRAKLGILQDKLQAGGAGTPLAQELLSAGLPLLARELEQLEADEQVRPPHPAKTPSAPVQAITAGMQKFSAVAVPVLAIYAIKPGFAVADEAQASAFERANPSARVVRLPNANHYVFRSNEADVLREIQAFVDKLPPGGAAR
jgi:pimeloyl-ACP methyl ester carboxylesterase